MLNLTRTDKTPILTEHANRPKHMVPVLWSWSVISYCLKRMHEKTSNLIQNSRFSGRESNWGTSRMNVGQESW